MFDLQTFFDLSPPESSLDFDAYWKAWLASQLSEMREKAAARARQQQQEDEEEERLQQQGGGAEEF
ncbi:MAG TPA: hypothetical protein VHA09_09025 [Nitrososphaera sp.]|nr:hypothetical protein [Nitrososphaera sp.]